MLSTLPDLICTFDLDGRFTYANPALLGVWQKSLHEIIGQNTFDLGYPPDLFIVNKVDQAIMKLGLIFLVIVNTDSLATQRRSISVRSTAWGHGVDLIIVTCLWEVNTRPQILRLSCGHL